MFELALVDEADAGSDSPYRWSENPQLVYLALKFGNGYTKFELLQRLADVLLRTLL